MIGVTIAIGKKYLPYANAAAEKSKRHLGLDDVIIITEKHRHLAAHLGITDPKSLSCILKFWAFEITKADRFIYFDADLNFIQTPPKEQIKLIEESEDLLVVRDRISRDDVQKCEDKTKTARGTYFNAGLIVANRKSHHAMFKWCQKNYHSVNKTYWDQCAFNHAAHLLGVKTTFLNRNWNMMDRWGTVGYLKPYAWHQAANYAIYEGTETEPQWWLTPDAGKMATLDGLKPFPFSDLVLYGDGFSNKDILWGITRHGRIFMHNTDGALIWEGMIHNSPPLSDS